MEDNSREIKKAYSQKHKQIPCDGEENASKRKGGL